MRLPEHFLSTTVTGPGALQVNERKALYNRLFPTDVITTPVPSLSVGVKPSSKCDTDALGLVNTPTPPIKRKRTPSEKSVPLEDNYRSDVQSKGSGDAACLQAHYLSASSYTTTGETDPLVSYFSKNKLLDKLEDEDGIENDFLDTTAPFLASETNEDLVSLIQIHGPESLQKKIRKLFSEEFKGILSTVVPMVPCNVPPMVLQVDDTLWESSKHKGPPRRQSPSKEVEIRKQLAIMLGRGVIRESKSPYYSQVHLAPKPGTNKFRFCIDYRELNTVTKAQGWPLPNIKEMLQRLGARRSKYYGVLDLTSGYHQTPISLNSTA